MWDYSHHAPLLPPLWDHLLSIPVVVSDKDVHVLQLNYKLWEANEHKPLRKMYLLLFITLDMPISNTRLENFVRRMQTIERVELGFFFFFFGRVKIILKVFKPYINLEG